MYSLRHPHLKRGTKLRVVQQALEHALLKITILCVQLAWEDMSQQLQEHTL